MTPMLVGGLAFADVVTDGSVGSAQTLSGTAISIDESLGETHGGNLFHSFSTFDLVNTQTATFVSCAGITNIISRITGGTQSVIDGTVNADTHLYLLNPQGFVFGENAVLNVNGSLYISSADYLTLQDGGRFDAGRPDNSVLSSAPPAAFGFLSPNPGGIALYSAQMHVADGADLAIIGGDVTVSGAGHPAYDPAGSTDYELTVQSNTGRSDVVLACMRGAGELAMDWDAAAFSEQGNLTIDNVDISIAGTDPGTLYVRSGELTVHVNDRGSLVVDYDGDQDAAAPAIEVDAKTVSIENTGIENYIAVASRANAGGRGGDIDFSITDLLMKGNSSDPDGNGFVGVLATTEGGGRGGDIHIDGDTITLQDNGAIRTVSDSDGNAGDVVINTRSLRIASQSAAQAGIGALTLESSGGDGGNVSITAEDIALDRGGSGFVAISTQGKGNAVDVESNGGDITIHAGQLTVNGGAQIVASIFQGTGQGGDVAVFADSIDMQGTSPGGFPSGIFSGSNGGANVSGSSGTVYVEARDIQLYDGAQINTFSDSFGDAGNISVLADTLSIRNGSMILASSLGAGVAGDITVDADTMDIGGNHQAGGFSGIFNISGIVAAGAGDIQIHTGSLSMRNGGEISNDTSGAGNGGTMTIQADSMNLSGSNENTGEATRIRSVTRVYLDFTDFATGNGGVIQIQTGELTVNDGAYIAVDSASQGNAGKAYIEADAIDMSGGRISASSSSSGNGGLLAIKADSISLFYSQISASSELTGLTGNISISARGTLAMAYSSILTRAAQSDGGNITLAVTNRLDLSHSTVASAVSDGTGSGGNIAIDPVLLVLRNASVISADARGGNGGNISIAADNFIASPDSSVTASSQFGLDGEVLIETPGNGLTESLDRLPPKGLDVNRLIRNNCQAVAQGTSTFLVERKQYPGDDPLAAIASDYDRQQVDAISTGSIPSVSELTCL